MMFDGRSGLEFMSTMMSGPILLSAPRGDGHSVIIVPGFRQAASQLMPLQCYLDSLGYDTHTFIEGGGAANRETVSQLAERAEDLSNKGASPVSLIGWSLGGLIARAVAVERPRCVRQVITLSSPFAGDPSDNSLVRMHDRMSSVPLVEVSEDIKALARGPLPVPTSAIYSRSDGLLPWKHCINDASAVNAENIEVISSHGGVGMHPVVMLVVANRLRQSPEVWSALPLHSGQPCLSSLLPWFTGAGSAGFFGGESR